MTNIVLCEDDPLIRMTLTEFISSHDYHVIEAVDGTEALEIINSQSIDMVISDIHMSPMDGLSLLSKLRNQKNHIPFILVTGKPDIESFIKGVNDLGAFEYIQKPFDFNLLMTMIKKMEHRK